MKPPRLLICLSAAAVLITSGAAAHADAPTATPDRPAATLDACVPAGVDGGPSLTATGALPADPTLPGATLSLRFELLARSPGDAGFTPADDGRDAWIRSAPGATGLVWTRTVQALEAPATYRVRVRMRWSLGGRVQRVTTRTTAPCRQPAAAPSTGP